MTRILQISDPHIMPEGALFQGRIDTATALRDMLAGLTGILPAIGPVARLVISGDLTETGCAAAYQQFDAIMADCPLPWRAIPGNHDSREGVRTLAATAPWMPREGPINWCENLDGTTLLGLDTLVEGRAGGALSDETLDWLRATLSALRGRPVLVLMHHPPMETGIAAMDAIGLARPGPLEATLRAHDGPVQIACGHVHRMMTGRFADREVVIAPGTSHAVGLDLHPDAALGILSGHVGAVLHELGPKRRTCLISPHDFAPPRRFE